VSYVLSNDAEEELAQAAAFYLAQASFSVANAFVDEFERTASLIVEYPGLGTPTSRGRRLMPLRRFPFSLLYRVEGAEVKISAIAHQRRRPGYWRSRG
jgi:toxin ParE1/3/4